MSVDTWATVGTIVATLVFLVVPGLVYTWYALEHLYTLEEGTER